MTQVLLTGRAERNGDVFNFKVGPWVHGIGLMVHRTENGTSIETGAGIWPSIEKAKEIAAQIVFKAFGPECGIVWTPIAV